MIFNHVFILMVKHNKGQQFESMILYYIHLYYHYEEKELKARERMATLFASKKYCCFVFKIDAFLTFSMFGTSPFIFPGI